MSGIKHDDGKLPLHLLSGPALFEIADVLRYGALEEGYGERNWEKGLQYSRIFAAAQRHLWKWWVGHQFDDKSRRHHLAHAACCLMFLLHYELFGRYSDFDDRPQDHQHGVCNCSLPARGGPAPAAGGEDGVGTAAVSGGAGEAADGGAVVRVEMTPDGMMEVLEDGTTRPRAKRWV